MHHHLVPFVAERQRERLGHGRPSADVGELERLVRRAAARDDGAWRSLAERFGPRIKAVAREYRLNSHDAEDVVQATLLQLVLNIGRLREPAKLGAYLHTTACRISLATAQRARRAPALDPLEGLESVASDDDGPHAQTEALELTDTVQDALRALPDRQRRLMALLLAEPAPSYAAIAATLDIPIGSIGPTRARSLERLSHDPRLLALAGA